MVILKTLFILIFSYPFTVAKKIDSEAVARTTKISIAPLTEKTSCTGMELPEKAIALDLCLNTKVSMASCTSLVLAGAAMTGSKSASSLLKFYEKNKDLHLLTHRVSTMDDDNRRFRELRLMQPLVPEKKIKAAQKYVDGIAVYELQISALKNQMEESADRKMFIDNYKGKIKSSMADAKKEGLDGLVEDLLQKERITGYKYNREMSGLGPKGKEKSTRSMFRGLNDFRDSEIDYSQKKMSKGDYHSLLSKHDIPEVREPLFIRGIDGNKEYILYKGDLWSPSAKNLDHMADKQFYNKYYSKMVIKDFFDIHKNKIAQMIAKKPSVLKTSKLLKDAVKKQLSRRLALGGIVGLTVGTTLDIMSVKEAGACSDINFVHYMNVNNECKEVYEVNNNVIEFSTLDNKERETALSYPKFCSYYENLIDAQMEKIFEGYKIKNVRCAGDKIGFESLYGGKKYNSGVQLSKGKVSGLTVSGDQFVYDAKFASQNEELLSLRRRIKGTTTYNKLLSFSDHNIKKAVNDTPIYKESYNQTQAFMVQKDILKTCCAQNNCNEIYENDKKRNSLSRPIAKEKSTPAGSN